MTDTTIRLGPKDNVAVARLALAPGAPVIAGLAVRDPIPSGHKVALVDIATGEAVRKYGQIIGFFLPQDSGACVAPQQ